MYFITDKPVYVNKSMKYFCNLTYFDRKNWNQNLTYINIKSIKNFPCGSSYHITSLKAVLSG